MRVAHDFFKSSRRIFLPAVSLGRGTSAPLLSYIDLSEADGWEFALVSSLSRTERARHGRAGAGPVHR